MKKMIVLAIGAMMLVACGQKGPKAEEVKIAQKTDSLNRIIQQKDNEINDMVSTINDIEEGFRAINQAQNRVTVAQQGEGANAVERIRENIQIIQQTMQHMVQAVILPGALKGLHVPGLFHHADHHVSGKAHQAAGHQNHPSGLRSAGRCKSGVHRRDHLVSCAFWPWRAVIWK